MNFNGRNKGYQRRGGLAAADSYNTEYDLCACGKKKFPTQYVCQGCMTIPTDMTPTPLLMTDEPEIVKNGKACSTCEHVKACYKLVINNYPVKCEIWDELDMLVLAPEDVS